MMKKIMVLLFVCIFMTSITACTDSPDKIYGIYKDVNEKRDMWGYIYTLSVSEKEIKFTDSAINYPVKKYVKKDDNWIAENPNGPTRFAVLKFIDKNTFEYIRHSEGQEKFIGTYVKITDEEFKTIRNTPKKCEPVKELPLFGN